MGFAVGRADVAPEGATRNPAISGEDSRIHVRNVLIGPGRFSVSTAIRDDGLLNDRDGRKHSESVSQSRIPCCLIGASVTSFDRSGARTFERLDHGASRRIAPNLPVANDQHAD